MIEDWVIWVGYSVAASLIVAVPVGLMAWDRARDNARIEWRFPRLLSNARDWARGARSTRVAPPPAAPRHRATAATSGWARWLAARGQIREPAGYKPPPPLTPEPDPRSWTARNRKDGQSAAYVNRVRGEARVPRRDRWEALDATRAVLTGDMRLAADSETTGWIPRVQSEVPR